MQNLQNLQKLYKTRTLSIGFMQFHHVLFNYDYVSALFCNCFLQNVFSVF